MNYLKHINYKYRLIPRHKNGNKIVKAQGGSNSNTWSEVGNAASYMIPIYGTYRSIKDAWDNPTLSNIGMAGLSLAGDIGTVVGAGALLKGAVGASKAAKAVNTAAKGYESATAATRAAQAVSRASTKAAQKASGKVISLTLQGAPTNIIMNAQKAANAARTTAKTDRAAYRAASIAENGWDPINKTINIGTNGTNTGVFQRTVTGGKYVGQMQPWSVYQGARGVYDGAQNMAKVANNTYQSAKIGAAASVAGNVGAHAGAIGINSSNFKK